MATGQTNNYEIPYPLAADSVNVHNDIKQLADKIEAVLPAVSFSQLPAHNNSGETINAGDPVYVTGYTTAVSVARAKHGTTAPVLGLAKSQIANGATGLVVVAGIVSNINTSAFSAGDVLYSGEDGGLSSSTDHGGAVCVVIYAAEHGIVSVDSKGNGTWGALKAGLS